MMSFYEEFGVRNDASVEEIRQAYKTLARVLHPDSQIDEKLRAVAARQMKRLHEILDVLVDPRKRRAYDESLAPASYPNAVLRWTQPEPSEPFDRPPAESTFAQSALRHWSWVLMGCMIGGSGFWYLTARVPAPAQPAPGRFSAMPPPAATGPAPPERAARQDVSEPVGRIRLSPEAGLALPETPAGDAAAPPGIPLVSPPAQAALPAMAPARAPEVWEPASAPSVPYAPRSSFAGEWFYAPAIEKPDPHLYAPEDIEFQLTEKDGALNGQYRGRYKVPDAAVSQDVVFQVQGKSSVGPSTALLWKSSDGANGEIDLDLLQPNLMKVSWWTTRLGRQPGLSSGAATLFRQQTP